MSCRRLFPLAAAIVGIWVSSVSAQTITEFPLPTASSGPYDIAAGPDGNLWFTEVFGVKIGRITPLGVISEFPVPAPDATPLGITAGPDGNLWFTVGDYENGIRAAVGRITPVGTITIFPHPNPFSPPEEITHGPDGALWFTEPINSVNGIGRITTSGTITEWPIPTPSSGPADITAGPDGNLWFTEAGGNKIARITTAGLITEFPLPTAGSLPGGITAGPDGNLWFTERSANKIGRITPSGVVTEFSIPTPASRPSGITAGPDGNLWFTAPGANKIGRITPGGVITEFSIPTTGAEPQGITAGPDDAIWFTEVSVNKIGRITTGIAADPEQILPVVGSTAGVGGSFFRTSVQLHNSGTTPSIGGIRFHPSSTAGSGADPVLTFTLAPGETRTVPDLLPAMGLSGLGSADVFLTAGSAGNVPVVTARVFNDAGAAGTTGFAFNALLPEEALSSGRRGVLLIPADLVNYRLNIGVRTLTDVALTLTVRNAAGVVAATVPKFYPATYHEQQAATAFLNGLALPAGGSITVLVEAGSAIVYGATVDNRTGDPSLQIARAAP